MRARRYFPIDETAVRLGIGRLREELDVPAAFPADVLAAAASAQPCDVDRTDRRDIPFVTIDPPGSVDLDQALAIEETGDGGHLVWYAIADVASFVTPGDPVDLESRRRGLTLYTPDGRAPLHPAALSEGSASLLPGQDRPAVLWRLGLDPDGALVDTTVGRAIVRSREQLTYETAQQRVDDGDVLLEPLRTVGERRLAQQTRRGGVSLSVPDQEVRRDGDHFHLRFRASLPVEEWNAQLSLLCGMAAADLMLGSRHGMLRTLPPPPPGAVDELRRHAVALGVPWPEDQPYAEVVSAADSTTPTSAAFLQQCTTLFRGADYLPLPAPVDPDDPKVLVHAAIAAPYAHVTAPLRRLGDRFATEAVLAVVDGSAPPSWVEDALVAMPEILRTAGQKASALDRAAVDLTEALVLVDRIGETFDAVAVKHRRDATVVQFTEPAVVATVDGLATLGSVVRVRVDAVDPVERRTALTIVG